MAWDLSCPDWEARLRAGLPPIRDLPLNVQEAEAAVRVFDQLRLADVPGNPRLRDAAGDWFRAIVRALFGSLDATTGERLIREVLALVPKKNSKTSYGALLMLTALIRNRRPKARFIMTAPTQDITELAFAQIEGAIRLDPVLDRTFHIRGHIKTIVHRRSQATLEIMSFDPAVLTGQKPAGIFVDEVHVVAKMAKASNAIRQLRGGMIALPESFLLFITTQSEEAPVGIFKAELTKARAIRDGTQTGAMLPVLYEFPEAMQRDQDRWRDPANWPMVTPNAGRSITIPRLIEEFHTAEATGAEELRAWASQHLNVEIGVAMKSDGWPGAEFWEQQGDEGLGLDDLIARCEVLCVGIDGGGLDDLLGLAVIGRERGTGHWLHWGRAWAHPIVLERRKKEAARLRDFEAAGDLVFVQRIGEDVAEVVEIVARIRNAGLLGGVGLDPVGIGAIVDALAEKKISGPDLIIGIPQGYRLNGAIKTVERKLAEGTLRHAAQPLMAWSVGNAKVEQKGNAVVITKQASGSAKIDPLMALFDAGELMSRNPKPKGASVYQQRGLVAL